MRKIAALPSLLTLSNLLCGFHAIYFASRGTREGLLLAAWMVLIAMVFDALDGKVARLTRVSSEFGAELDSLADMVSFGIAPAFLVAALSAQAELHHQRLVWLSCMVYAVCTALRLARFNVQATLDEASHRAFSGLPSPAAAGQVVSLVILHFHVQGQFGVALISRVLPTIAFFAGVLMVSRVRYPHLVSRFLSGQHAFAELAFLAIVVLLVATHKEVTLAAGFTLYSVTGLVGVARHAVAREAEEEEPIF
jgi:CDP-diacylglycerol--serine O-phosphatidyltransferase